MWANVRLIVRTVVPAAAAKRLGLLLASIFVPLAPAGFPLFGRVQAPHSTKPSSIKRCDSYSCSAGPQDRSLHSSATTQRALPTASSSAGHVPPLRHRGEAIVNHGRLPDKIHA